MLSCHCHFRIIIFNFEILQAARELHVLLYISKVIEGVRGSWIGNGGGLRDTQAARVPDTGGEHVSTASEEEGGWGDEAGAAEEGVFPAA